MYWHLSNRCDPRGRVLADRHYNRQHVGAANFVPPGRCVVLLTENADALWVSSWPYAQYVRHAWAGAWINSLFRNESRNLASTLILDAISATRAIWGEPPSLGMVTFINRSKVKPKRDFGYCYRMAGFVECGETRGGLLALQLTPEKMPPPAKPFSSEYELL